MTLTFNLPFFFTKNPDLIKKLFFFLGGGGGGGWRGGAFGGLRGAGGGRWKMDGQRNSPKPICPFNFFEVGNALMYKLCP